MASKVAGAVSAFVEMQHEFGLFTRSVHDFFATHPDLIKAPLPIVHSVKSRVKDVDHLRRKIIRKTSTKIPITKHNVFRRITDLSGVRVLHLHHSQFPVIHRLLLDKVRAGDWTLSEKPIAYTWDPESARFFRDLGLRVAVKDTFYTSIHYVVRPNKRSPIACEIQVRTLFEEIWGEIDHALNYPEETSSVACREQLRVLARLVSTGTRLADAIFSSHRDHESKQKSALKRPARSRKLVPPSGRAPRKR